MKKNNVLGGMFLILIAAIMMGSSLGLIPDLPWFKLLCGAALAIWTVKALFRREYFGTFISLGLIAWLFERELGISDITPFPLLIAAGLVGIGLNMIFEKKSVVQVEYYNDARKEEWQDGRVVVLKNNFNSANKYVNSAAFGSAKLENNFGSANVYFNNAVIYKNEATIDLENNFGKMNVYIPNKWRATITQNSTFGNVKIFGEPNHDMDAPHVIIKAASNFGEVNIFFD